MHSFTWNGKNSQDFGIMIEKDPDKNRPAKKYSVTNIAGRNGNYYQVQNTFEEVERKYNLFCSLGMDAIDTDSTTIRVNRSTVPLENLQVNFTVAQEGTGDPTPDNVRNIDMVNRLILTVSNNRSGDKSYTVYLNRYIGVGTLDAITGELAVTHIGLLLDALATWEKVTLSDTDNSYYFKITLTDAPQVGGDLYCNLFTPTTGGVGIASWKCRVINGEFRIRPDDSINTVAKLRQWLFNHTIQVIYQLATPATYQIEPVKVQLKSGINTITTNSAGAEVAHVYASGLKPQNELLTDIVEWLYEPNGYAILSDTYDPDHYRKAVMVNAVNITDLWQKYGRAQVTFRCRPERYLTSGQHNIIDLSETSQVGRITGVRAVPLYDNWQDLNRIDTLYGGICSILSSETTARNNQSNSINVRSEPDISSDIIAVVPPQQSVIVLAQSDEWIQVQVDDDTVGWTQKQYYSVSGWYEIQIDGETGWILERYVTLYDATTFENPTKRVAKPLIKVTASGAFGLQINNIRLVMNSHEYETVYIDCENENIYGYEDDEYVSYNRYANLYDPQNNVTASFLSLVSGSNIIIVDNIDALEIDANFWEL